MFLSEIQFLNDNSIDLSNGQFRRRSFEDVGMTKLVIIK